MNEAETRAEYVDPAARRCGPLKNQYAPATHLVFPSPDDVRAAELRQIFEQPFGAPKQAR